jgi:NADPH2:quinone reductase
MGLVLTLLLQARGVGPVTIVETNAARRDLARRLTQAQVCDPEEVTDVRAPWVIEATGNPRAFESALACVQRAGTLLVFGVASPTAVAEVSPHRIYADELTIVGSMAILRTFGPAVDAVAQHADLLAPLVTDTVTLDDIGLGLEAVKSGTAVKVVVDPSA